MKYDVQFVGIAILPNSNTCITYPCIYLTKKENWVDEVNEFEASWFWQTSHKNQMFHGGGKSSWMWKCEHVDITRNKHWITLFKPRYFTSP